ncbi:hypothetical protein BVE84_06945 [Streptococcus azizii]|uniref:Uncharacterized protein n=1 Tax=Streptococcus azizii TaxID=1579424 RepID=A0AB36JSJ7_9STRE|nr:MULTISPECIES: hypothetical protein [Streptococcus]MBF0775426.1 hypothetical protein [Streptococcus sp. 19428wD3_AN2]ONK26789.1 hypothetical protein BVE86_06765 [Streptococcus azizii]ONK27356.1 hypothetical protein BVE85_06750 [Streptococcus azizii]ONK28300.1 hypothetical protein BVE84_06945 [Streptococcus azizii]TFU84593.1 hypothetical protein E4T83_01365 [Streptococcus sp. AN2]
MDKKYLQEKLAGLRSKYIDSHEDEQLAKKFDDVQMSKKMVRIKQKLVSLEMERCQKQIEHRDLSKIDEKISEQRLLFEKCCHKK